MINQIYLSPKHDRNSNRSDCTFNTWCSMPHFTFLITFYVKLFIDVDVYLTGSLTLRCAESCAVVYSQSPDWTPRSARLRPGPAQNIGLETTPLD